MHCNYVVIKPSMGEKAKLTQKWKKEAEKRNGIFCPVIHIQLKLQELLQAVPTVDFFWHVKKISDIF